MKFKIFLLLVWLVPLLTVAQIPASTPNSFVNDFAKRLDAAQIKTLNDSILSLEKNSSVQLAIVLVNEIPENMVIEDYAREIGRTWHVGKAHNGLVYVAAINQRKQRLEVAEKLEGDIPDLEALHITDEVKPFFRNEDYAGGLLKLVQEIRERVDPIAKEQLRLANIKAEEDAAKAGAALLNVLLWLGILSLAGYGIYRLFFLPGIRRRREEAEELEAKLRMDSINEKINSSRSKGGWDGIIAIIPLPMSPPPQRPSSSPQSSYSQSPYSPPASSYKSESDNNNSTSRNSDRDYGNYGNDNDNNSGFSGGGSNNDW